jgi:formamidopyrimidine-DNA glycosylase
MFELPELINLSRQFNDTLLGKTIRTGSLGNSPHKFVWYNRSETEFMQLAQAKQVGHTRARGRWLFTPLDPGYVLVLGELGGKILFHAPGTKLPAKYHMHLEFEDGSLLTVAIQMWGAIELYETGKEQERQYIQGMRAAPLDAEFTLDYFSGLINALIPGEKRSVKGLLTQEQLIPGLGNSIAQDILFNARLHPRHPIDQLTVTQTNDLYKAILETVNTAIAAGGRNDEVDLYGKPGGYVRLMDSKSAGKPCPQCGTTIEKMQYLGGACYFCPKCQE